MTETKDIMESLMHELRRGSIVVGVLSQLAEPQYGYSLVAVLEAKGVPVDAGTLYPLLRRLEKQGLLVSEWDTNEARPRKYYGLSPLGKEVYTELRLEWKRMSESLERLLEP